MRSIGTLMALLVSIALICCGDSGETQPMPSSSGCTEAQVQVEYFEGEQTRTECAMVPAACGASASCEDSCRGALYDLCQAPAFGVGCSDTFPPVIVSCNT